MRDLTPPWIKLKATLFLIAGLLASALLVQQNPSLRTLFLLAICIWTFCRAYYFAFHVLERYLGHGRYSGLLSLLRDRASRVPHA